MKKRIVTVFLSICFCLSLVVTSSANEYDDQNEFFIPSNAKYEVIDGKNIYSNFTDSDGNFYDYYCADDGSYFRWLPTVETDSLMRTRYDTIRPFEFEFGADGLVGTTFSINYDSGYFILDSYLYNNYYEQEVDTIVSYDFTVKLKQKKTLINSTVATLNTSTNNVDVKNFTCTNGGTYFFDFTLTEQLPPDSATEDYFVKGNGTIYGATE